jgi:hypothetical protein
MLSPLRLNLLRFLYSFTAIGLALVIWPGVISHPNAPLTSAAASHSLLAGIGLMAAWGLRHPQKMLPILLFEMLWKVIYLGFYALPLWSAGAVDQDSWENIRDCLLIVIFIPLIPWRYVAATYLTQGGERWK